MTDSSSDDYRQQIPSVTEGLIHSGAHVAKSGHLLHTMVGLHLRTVLALGFRLFSVLICMTL